MSFIETIILVVINLITFIVGLKFGQMVTKNKEIILNPIRAIKENKKTTKITKEEKLQETILKNIDNYNGTSVGQEDLPR